MKVFVAGATGALGQQLVPALVSNGHEVVGMTSKPEKHDLVRRLGARPVVADALDPDAVAQAVAEADPQAIVHQLTGLSRTFDLRDYEGTFALTNRLRTEGTDHLLAAGRAVGVERFVAQSYAGWPFARTGPMVKRRNRLAIASNRRPAFVGIRSHYCPSVLFFAVNTGAPIIHSHDGWRHSAAGLGRSARHRRRGDVRGLAIRASRSSDARDDPHQIQQDVIVQPSQEGADRHEALRSELPV